jgi:hypothetical protein
VKCTGHKRYVYCKVCRTQKGIYCKVCRTPKVRLLYSVPDTEGAIGLLLFPNIFPAPINIQRFRGNKRENTRVNCLVVVYKYPSVKLRRTTAFMKIRLVYPNLAPAGRHRDIWCSHESTVGPELLCHWR